MNQPAFPGLSRIGQINVPIQDLERAIDFYRHTLGLTFLFQVPGMAFFDCDGVRLLLARPEDPTFDHPSSIIYFLVTDIHSATEALRDRGARITGEPELIAPMPDHDLWMSFFEDYEGNTLALMAEVPRPS